METEIILQIVEKCARVCDASGRIGSADWQREVAFATAASVLRPHVPAGLWQWAVKPQPRESARAYARRAVRYLIARCAEAGVECSLRHKGAEVLGMLGAHIGASGPTLLDCVERDAADCAPAQH